MHHRLGAHAHDGRASDDALPWRARQRANDVVVPGICVAQRRQRAQLTRGVRARPRAAGHARRALLPRRHARSARVHAALSAAAPACHHEPRRHRVHRRQHQERLWLARLRAASARACRHRSCARRHRGWYVRLGCGRVDGARTERPPLGHCVRRREPARRPLGAKDRGAAPAPVRRARRVRRVGGPASRRACAGQRRQRKTPAAGVRGGAAAQGAARLRGVRRRAQRVPHLRRVPAGVLLQQGGAAAHE
jgi:hypothetical protein